MGMKLKRIAAMLVLMLTIVPVSANAAGEHLVPVGRTVGISLETDGVLVSGFRAVQTVGGGEANPAADAGIRVGDIITHADSRRIYSAEDLMSVLDDCSEKCVEFTVNRKGSAMCVKVIPVSGTGGALELGILVRDKIAGIGTVTFYDTETGRYGALGHSVNDPESGNIISIRGGSIIPAEVTSVKTGESGAPGELRGSFNPSQKAGSVTKNTEQGIFGDAADEAEIFCGEALCAAAPNEIKTGKAEIIATVEGSEPQHYAVTITRIFGHGAGRDMLIEVTDEALNELTGGIVQGMSGCPIIQNDKLVGAVTHVLVDDPTKGYAISIERMLDAAA